MIKNYYKTALRNLLHQKFFVFVNSFGLSIAIAFCMLIFLYIQDEGRFDSFHKNKNDIFRINEVRYFGQNATQAGTMRPDTRQKLTKSAYLPAPLGSVLKDELPEVVKATRYNSEPVVVKHKNLIFTENAAYVDADFFSMFSFRVKSGNSDHFFETKNEVVITESIARKYFGDVDPLDTELSILIEGEEHLFTISGVLEDVPSYSSFNFELLLPEPVRPYYENAMSNWRSFNSPTFVQLQPYISLENFEANLQNIADKYLSDSEKHWRERQQIPAEEPALGLGYTNLKDIHMDTTVDWTKVSDPQYSYILGAIAFLILTIACINYISLSLSRSTARSLEVGIRKVSGATKGQLVGQFLFESILQSLIALGIAIALVYLFLPIFNEYTGKAIEIGLKDWMILSGFALGLSIITGFVAGSYPSFFLSSLKPIAVLKKQLAKVRRRFTTILVGIQFALSGSLIICSIIMFRQMNFITSKDLGYNRDQVVVIPTQTGWTDEGEKMVQRFRNNFNGDPDIVDISGTNASFNRGWNIYSYKIHGEDKSAYVYRVDHEYIPLLGIQLLEGRNFDPNIPSDKNAIIINEALVKDMGYEDPLSEQLAWREDSVGDVIIGVMKNYNFLSLEYSVKPLFLLVNPDQGKITTMLIKIAPGKLKESMEKLQQAWKRLSPDKPYDYSFMDEDVARQYGSYTKWSKITGLATFFAILIACLGLFGLSGINAANRTKEVGIRKVLGASFGHILFVTTREYFILSFLAFVSASPIAWYIMEKWLASFTYSISLGWGLFAAAMVAGLFLTLITVSYHSLKSSLINPADSLRYE